MNHRLCATLVAVASMLAGACGQANRPGEVVRVVVVTDSGPILPELAWSERFVIDRDGVILERNSMQPDSEVNVGTWEVAADPDAVEALLSQLAAVDTRSVRRIEPETALDGGHTASYSMHYRSGASFELYLDPGTQYTHETDITGCIDAFIDSLELPPAAAARYREQP